MSKHRVLSPVDHDNKRYNPGDIIELKKAEQADALVSAGAIAPDDTDSAEGDQGAGGKASAKTKGGK